MKDITRERIDAIGTHLISGRGLSAAEAMRDLMDLWHEREFLLSALDRRDELLRHLVSDELRRVTDKLASHCDLCREILDIVGDGT